MSNFKIRKSVNSDILSAMRKIFDAIQKNYPTDRPGSGIGESCISCLNFNEGTEICKLANARPPARVIAFGCPKYDDVDDIPF